MHITDPIADMLTRIRNANSARHDTVDVPASNMKKSIFDNRFQYMDELRRMGADILVDGKVAVIQGGKPLTAAPVKAVDLRAGAALVIAGLAAKGTTEVEDIHHIERGYECIVDKLRHLGADIELVQQAEPGLRTAL